MKKARTTSRRRRAMLFTRVMARAVALGRKSQTRRWMKGVEKYAHAVPFAGGFVFAQRVVRDDGGRLMAMEGCTNPVMGPYGVAGDQLVLLTGWATSKKFDHLPPSEIPPGARLWSWFDSDEKPRWCGRTRMGRHLPTWARAKMPLAEVVRLRAERVNSISEEDAKAEGMTRFTKDGLVHKWWPCDPLDGPLKCAWQDLPHSAREAFLRLFFGINTCADEGADPWVWVVEFKVISIGGRVHA